LIATVEQRLLYILQNLASQCFHLGTRTKRPNASAANAPWL
jgi:hypothetical protein